MNNNKYTIIERLGGGGFGDTYLARNNKGKPFVIKTINDKTKQAPYFDKFRLDFYNEAVRAANCNHPHIVKIIEIIEEEGLPCIVMEYIPGETLASKVKKQGALPETEALNYIKQVGNALSIIHQRTLLHRDIKPLNIIIRENGISAVLIDFGAARYFNPEDPASHTVMLSEGYAPIEQYDRGSKQAPYTDIYALAATLYYLLTARVPPNAIARSNHKPDPLKPPKSINPQISDRTNNAIGQAMALKPQNRPQTIEAFLDLLCEKPPVRTHKQLIPVLSLVAVGIVASLAYFFTRPPAYVPWNSAEENIKIHRPPDWEVLEDPFGNVAVFASPQDGDTDREQLTLTVENVHNISLAEYTSQTIARIKQNITQDIVVTKETELDNNPAVQVVYHHIEGGQSLKTLQTWTIEGDRAYILTYTAQKDNHKYDNEVGRMIESLVIDR